MVPFEIARVMLANVIRKQYADLHAMTGKRYRLVRPELAPATAEEVLEAWNREGAFPVSSEGLSNSIYGVDEINAQFRFVHDSLHARYGFGFDTAGELRAAERHVYMTVKALACDATLTKAEITSVCFLLWLDTAGQAIYYRDNAGAFLDNQVATVREWYNERGSLSEEIIKGFISIMNANQFA